MKDFEESIAAAKLKPEQEHGIRRYHTLVQRIPAATAPVLQEIYNQINKEHNIGLGEK